MFERPKFKIIYSNEVIEFLKPVGGINLAHT